MKAQDANFIHPEDSSDFNYWSRKWGVSAKQLDEAILYTGSLNTARIKDYLRKNTSAGTPSLLIMWKSLKSRIKFMS